MVPRPFDDGGRTRVANGEALTDGTGDEQPAAGRPVQTGVARPVAAPVDPGTDDHLAAGHALADVVVPGPVELDRDALRQERGEALAGGPRQADLHGTLGQTGVAPDLGDLARQAGPDGAVDVLDGVGDHDRTGAPERRPTIDGELLTERRSRHPTEAPIPTRVGPNQQRGEVAGNGIVGIGRDEQVASPDQLLEAAGTDRRHRATGVLGDEPEQVDDVVDRAAVLGPQVLPLGGDTDRAGVLVAAADHLAAEGEQRCGPEAVPIGAEEGGHDHVAAGAETPVGLDGGRRPQPVGDEGLVRLGETQLPRRPGVLDRHQRRSAGSPAVAGDHHGVGEGLGDTDGDRTDAGTRDELHRHPGQRLERLQVVDELREVLDRVDVVMRRRRDERHPGFGVAEPSDLLGDLVAGELTAFAGLGALCHLDLELLGRRQVPGGHAEPSAGHLLDRRIARRPEATRVLAALPRVGEAADEVHRLGERLVRLGGQCAEGHRSGREPAHDAFDRLHLLERNGRAEGNDLEKIAQLHRGAVPLDRTDVVLVAVPVPRANGLLEGEDGCGGVDVLDTAATELVVAGDLLAAALVPGVASQGVLGDPVEAGATDPPLDVLEGDVADLLVEADRLEELRSPVGGDRAHPHLRHDLEEALLEARPVVLLRLDGPAGDPSGGGHRPHVLDRHVGVDGRGPEADQACEVVGVAGLSGDRHDRRTEPEPDPDEVMVDGPHGEEDGNGRMVGVGLPI